MAVKNQQLSFILVISAVFSACSVAENQTAQTLGINQQVNPGGLGTYLVIDCNEPGSVLVDPSEKEVKSPVRLSVKSDKQKLESITLRAEIPAHISLEDPARALVGERRLEITDARVISGSYFDTRSRHGFKYQVAEDQKITVTKNGQKKVSNIRSIEIGEAKGADYVDVQVELEGGMDQSSETVLLAICDMKNRTLLGKFPK